MVIKTHPKFDKNYEKRIRFNPKLDKRFSERISLFSQNPSHPTLDDHPLKGSKRFYRSFSITGDIRVVYYPISDKEAFFVDIGSHNQVY